MAMLAMSEMKECTTKANELENRAVALLEQGKLRRSERILKQKANQLESDKSVMVQLERAKAMLCKSRQH